MSACQRGDFFESAHELLEASRATEVAPPQLPRPAVERPARPRSAGRGPRPTSASPSFYGSSFNKLSLRSHATTFGEVMGKWDRGQLGGALARRSHMSFKPHRKDPDNLRHSAQRIASSSGSLRSRTPEPSICHHRSVTSPLSPSSCVTFGEMVGKWDRGQLGGALARRSHMSFTHARKTNEPLAAAHCGLGESPSHLALGESPARRLRPQSAGAAERSLRKVASEGSMEHSGFGRSGSLARSPHCGSGGGSDLGMSPGGCSLVGDNPQAGSPISVPMFPKSLMGK
mmetsp:Transcript_93014/g.199487  ORF Transcript_93014/g.199487 Transcript_93014/m.199487 type:complete len:286 (-) Transcript_93014:92-949(-)